MENAQIPAQDGRHAPVYLSASPEGASQSSCTLAALEPLTPALSVQDHLLTNIVVLSKYLFDRNTDDTNNNIEISTYPLNMN